MKITNLTNGTLDFVTGARNGEAVCEAIRAGETKSLNVKADDPVLVARVFTRAVRVEGGQQAVTKAVAKTHAPADKPAE